MSSHHLPVPIVAIANTPEPNSAGGTCPLSLALSPSGFAQWERGRSSGGDAT